MNFPVFSPRGPGCVAILAAALLSLGGAGLMLGWHAALLPPEIMTHRLQLPHFPAAMTMTLAGIALWLQIHPAPFSRQAANRLLGAIAQGMAVLVILTGIFFLASIALGAPTSMANSSTTMQLEQYALMAEAISPLGAASFILAGCSLLLLDRKTAAGRYPAEYCALTIALIMCIPMIGLLFNVQLLAGFAPAPAFSRHAAPAFMILAAGILFSRPRHPMMTILLSPAPGGRLLRSVLPATLIMLVALDLLATWGAEQGYYSHALISPLALLVGGALLLVIFWRAALMLNHEYGSRLKGEAELARTNALIRIVSDCTTDAIWVKEYKGRYVFANPAALKILGRDLAAVIGHTSGDLFQDAEAAHIIEANDHAVLKQGKARAIEFPVSTETGIRTYHLTAAPWFGKKGEALGTVGIATDITERKRSEEAMKAQEVRLEKLVETRTREVRELVGHLETMREEEKRAIARELHDDLGASLTALHMHLAILFQQLPEDAGIAERILQIQALLRTVTATKRRIQNGLRPDKLDIFGIKTAILDQAQEFENYTGVPCRASLPDDEIQYSTQVEISLFRMVQEALNNIAKHASATHVDIIMDDDEDGIYLTIRDNGIGIATKTPPGHSTHGLRGMRERAIYLGGAIEIHSAPGAGTRIRIMLPKGALA